MLSLVFGLFGILCLLICWILIRREPRRIINGFVLETGVLLLVYALLAGSQEGDWRFTVVCVLCYLLYTFIFVLGIALLIDFFMVIRKEGLSIPNFLPLPFGVLAMVVAVAGYHDLTAGVSGSYSYVVIMSILNNIVSYVPFAIGAILIYSVFYLLIPKRKDADYIIILGCGLRKNGEVTPLLRGRVDRAIQWYHNGGSHAKFVVSGGQGADEVISESQAMKNYLLSQNIPEEHIIKEDQSVNTRENLLFSNEKIKQDGGGSTLICTSNYHVLRAVILARSLGVEAQGIGSHTALYYLPVAFLREYIAVIFRYKVLIAVYMLLAVVMGILM